ncbi:MAG TPA: ATP-binding protein, partial [Armatimonadota bacterium]|nr:ATP-binding protein [Armatimonadota bacterium]
AFTNAVRHGTSTAGSLIEASIRVSPSGCHVALCYLGEPFEAPPARLPDCHATGGRGRYLMDVLVDRVQYRFRDGITEIELHKNWL